MPVVIFGSMLTLLVHVALVAPLVFGSGHPRPTREEEEGGATSGIPEMTVVDLEDVADDEPERQRDFDAEKPVFTLQSRALIPVGTVHPSTGVAQRIDDEVSRSAEPTEQNDEGESALLFGRYLGQVTARIERAWLRPRSPVGANSFECLVQVEQDHDRTVKEITLKRCNGTPQWQLSLVRAIESASPFPAPPDPKVFSATLTFEMRANEFVRGESGEGFESEGTAGRQ